MIIKNITQLTTALGTIHNHLNRIHALQKALNEERIALEKKLNATVAPWQSEIDERLDAISQFALTNRSTWLTGDRKSAEFPAGKMGFRKLPLKVEIADENALASLEGYEQFVQVRLCINKHALKHAYHEDPQNSLFLEAISKNLLGFSGGEDEFFIQVGERVWKYPQ